MKAKFLAVLGTSVMATMLLAGCGNGSGSGVYTLREYQEASPSNWNPHTWTMSNDTYIPGYCEMGFVDLAMDPAKEGGYQFIYEMATAIKDVTAADEYQQSDFMKKWGIAAGDVGRVWEFDLNENAKWENGVAINADTYVNSMKEDLDPHMKNYRAQTYYVGDVSLVGAYDYYLSDSDNFVELDKVDADKADKGATEVDTKNYVSWDTCLCFASSDWLGGSGGYVPSDFSAKKKGKGSSYFTTDSGDNLIDKYENGVEMTAAVIADIRSSTKLCNWLGIASDQDVLDLFGTRKLHFPAASFDSVGLVKLSDYKMLYIAQSTVSEFSLKTNMTSNWIVDTDLYDSKKVTTGELVTTSYGTTADSYRSFGPYKLVTFEKDKQIKFAKNDQWYGWTDGKHDGQYQTTNITCDIISQHSTALLSFQQGGLDSVNLETADLSTYGYSDYLLHTPETYTMRFVFNSNVDDLTALETKAADGKNKKILHEYEFRKALSLCIDRKRFNAEGTAGNEAAFGLLNSLYYYDVANNPTSIYRNTDDAKEAIVNLYGLKYGTGEKYATLNDAYKAVTGLDVDAAKALFTTAYNNAIADGNYTAGQAIHFQIGYLDATMSTTVAQIKLLNEFVATATAGTKLEGKISFEAKSFNGSETRYDAIGNGSIEISNCAWGGAAFYPFSTFDVYTGDRGYSKQVNEARFWSAKNENLTITYDWNKDGTVSADETKTTSIYNWQHRNGSQDDEILGANAGYTAARLHVLSCLETALLNDYNFAVVGSYATVSLFSKKIKYATTTYNIMYGYGGIRFMTYDKDDAQWDAYVKSQGGSIDYA